jgi:hypothetical protein
MSNFIDSVVLKLISKFSTKNVANRRELIFLAILVCKNITDLCDTCMYITKNIKSKKVLEILPSLTSIQLCKSYFKECFDDSMFIDDEELGTRPNWNSISKFNEQKKDIALAIYLAIKHNVMEKPWSHELRTAILNRDKKFFIENFDLIFNGLPLRQELGKFKGLLECEDIDKEDQECVWMFFISLTHIFMEEKDNIQDLLSLE